MKVLNFGSLNIDYVYSVDEFVKKGETVSSHSLEIYSGGKGLNQSLALARAGCHVFHAGAVGEDGGMLLDILNESGVDTRFIKVMEGEKTGHAIIQTDRENDNCILLHAGANGSVTEEMADEVLSGFGTGDILVLQNEISSLSYIAEKASGLGMTVFLNPSPADEKLKDIKPEWIDWLVLNEHEAALMAGTAEEVQSPETAAEKIIAEYPEIKIILTLGEKGSVYLDGKTRHYQQAYEADVTDTTAAGDTYTGYFIASCVKGLDAADAMDIASRASARAVSVRGAAPSIPWYEDIL